MLNVSQSYVFAQQQGLLNRIANFFSGNPNSQQEVYDLAQQKISTRRSNSPLLAEAQRNTRGMMDGMLHSLGFTQVTVIFEPPARPTSPPRGRPALVDRSVDRCWAACGGLLSSVRPGWSPASALPPGALDLATGTGRPSFSRGRAWSPQMAGG